MKKSDIKQLINNAIGKRQLCRVKFDYDDNIWFLFPLIANDKIFLCANEDDFILNGYSIRRFKDTERVECQEDKILDIIKAENIDTNIVIPTVDMTDWQTVFTSLQNQNIIVENEKAEQDEVSFVIGRIIRATRTKVVMKHFDADGIWEEEVYEIPYVKITSVSFGTRYVEIFSKYI